MFLQSVLVGTHLGKEFQGHWWQLCGEIQWSYGSRVMCQLLHFPAHSWSALIQHSWPSPFLLPLCKWPARSLSWKNLEWAQASTKVDTNTNGRQLKITPLKPWLASNTSACKHRVGLDQVFSRRPFHLNCTVMFFRMQNMSSHSNHRITQSM